MNDKIDALAFGQKGGAKPRARALLALAKQRPFVGFLACAGLVFALYFGLVHPPVYLATTQFSIRGKEAPQASSLLSAFIPAGIVGRHLREYRGAGVYSLAADARLAQ
ncbi:MAG: hypothetical protein AAGH41_06310 [Pseudomonadota bacterium]